jgi:predicted porin
MTPKFTMATLAAILLLGGQSYAADLGGNCCADLEERIAELEATTARKGNRKVTLEVYGQVNEAVLFSDVDGTGGFRSRIIPNTNSVSRFGFKGSAKISEEWSAGFLMEIGVGGFDLGGANNRDLEVRHSALYIKSNAIGTIWLGQTSTATDGIVEIDLSNSAIASTPLSLAPFDGALVGVSLLPFDGSRKTTAKYVSPEIGGFSVSAAWVDDQTYDAALRYAGEAQGFRLAAGIGYRHDDGPFGLLPETKSYLASASLMHVQSGLFASGSYGKQDLAGININLEGYAGRVGIEKKVTPIGATTFYGEYGELRATGIDAQPYFWNVGLVQSIDAAAMDVYVSYRNIDLDTGADKIQAVVVGGRIKF